MKLYNWQVAPNPRRVRMYLAEKGISDIETVEVGEPGKPGLSEAYLSGSPHRLVPALELDDGTVIGEAPVICAYLETLYPQPPLLGADAKERALVAMWDRKAEIEGMGACAEILRNKVKAFAGRALPGYTVRIEQIDALIERGTVRVGAFHDKLERALTGRSWLVGEQLSFADITAFCAVEMARAGKLDIPSQHASLRAWHERMAARASASA